MASAFGKAMIDSIGGKVQTFQMTMVGNSTKMECSCDVFLRTRREENELLDAVDLQPESRVLDWGCGVGRHFSYLRKKYERVTCCGIETCDLLRQHCKQAIGGPAEFVSTWREVSEKSFSLILLMGNGLGVLGPEEQAERYLSELDRSLEPGGQFVIETGNPFGAGYCSPKFTIRYRDQHDGPFCWGYADESWIKCKLQALGYRVNISPSTALGGGYFFAVGQKVA
jgi:SAM-dependent methyltransferase